MNADLDLDITDLDDAARLFAVERPRLFGIAYRMLGSAMEAEDIVQEVWLRWQRYDRASVLNPAAFLATTTTRAAINAAQSARARRETYVGPWLPEPVDTSADPALGAERAEALELAVLLLLEKLTPTERAAYVLREAFDYPYAQIAEIVQSTEATTRQYVSRARRHLATERRAPVSPSEQRRLLDAFIDAAQSGDMGALEQILALDVVSYSDGGGVVQAAPLPVAGRLRVARFVRTAVPRFWAGATLRATEVNGQPAVALERDGSVSLLFAVTASSEGIDQLLWVLNPTKLSRVQVSPTST